MAKWETGARRIAYRYVRSIADLFGSDPDEWMPKDEILFAELSECVPEGLDVSPSELEEELNGFLRTMDAESCDLFLQRYYYMEDYAAIAGKKSQKENRVRAKVSRIRKKLKRYLKEEMT